LFIGFSGLFFYFYRLVNKNEINVPKTEGNSAKYRDDKQLIIQSAALKLFTEKGYHGTSTAMIAKEAGISKGLLYHYIESKEKLIQEVCATIHSLIYEHFETRKNGVLSAEEFELFVTKSFETIRSNREFFRLIFTVSMIPDVRKIMMKEGEELGLTNEHTILRTYFDTHFKEPQKELSLFIALTKGATLLYCTECEFYTDEMLHFVEEEIKERYIIK
jgi:AcrR family transcriptional regulator